MSIETRNGSAGAAVQPDGAAGTLNVNRGDGIFAVLARWPKLTLLLLTVACLLPFSGKAFHIDDPIFIWTAQHITRHPLDFYGFSATWWSRATPMWQIQQNPPLAAYYMALVGSIAGWSERALHLGFMVPAIVVVLATHQLAQRLTRKPFVAAAATLVAPGFLVSATTLMCDVSTLALWMAALVFWVEGLEDGPKPAYLAVSGLLMAACALTKYFGISLIPLLFVYALMRRRSFRGWIAYFAIPLLLLAGFEFYTHHLYGYGLIGLAAGNPSTSGPGSTRLNVVRLHYLGASETLAGRILVGLSFAGGCTLPALLFAPLLWSRRQILYGAAASAMLGLAFWRGWINLGTIYQYAGWLHSARGWIGAQLLFYVAGGIGILALAIADYWKNRTAESLLLLLWIFGTLVFAVVVNWDVNARTMIPMIPAVAILIARRLEAAQLLPARWPPWTVAAPLVLCGVVSLWVAAGDMALANAARTAANYFQDKGRDDIRKPWFEGRWGFAYYMQQFGARPVEPEADQCRFGDLVVIPKYNTSLFNFPLKTTRPEFVEFPVNSRVATMNPDAGGGFYFSGWGPLPFVFGPVPPQRYAMARVLANP